VLKNAVCGPLKKISNARRAQWQYLRIEDRGSKIAILHPLSSMPNHFDDAILAVG